MPITRRTFVRLSASLPALITTGAWAYGSKEFWEAKPPAEWSSDEVDRLLTKSPWAKEVSVAFNGGPGGAGGGGVGGMGRPRGGIGFPGGGYPGGTTYPGGGSRYPGGGYPGGGSPGGRYPGGTGYPGGSGGGTGPDSGGGRRGFHGTVRWESALPVREALRIGAEHEKPNPDFDKYYVVTLLGELPMLGGDRLGDDDSAGSSAQRERREEMFKQYTKLERRGKAVQFVKVEEGSRIASSMGPGTHFYFSRLDDISAEDKIVTFSTKLGPLEINAKFPLKDMLYHGKLAL